MVTSPATTTASIHPLLEYLYSLEGKGIELGLERTRELLYRCGDPHKKFTIVQLAGTNGKGSTAAILAHILIGHKQRTGLFTSPHLLRFNERIRVDGIPVDDHYLIEWLEKYRADVEEISATFFEATTVMALSYFAEQQVDLAILETGLGGRLDATTATDPAWTALTPIDLDHTDMLGDDISAIAREKAGILRAGVPCFSAPQPIEVRDAIQREAGRVGAPVTFLGPEASVPHPPRLPGKHQQVNAALAWTLAQAILGDQFDRQSAEGAVKTVYWPGRYQQLNDHPRVIYDVAHNPHGMAAFLETLRAETIQGRKWLVLAIQKGKDARRLLKMLLPVFDMVILTQTGIRNFIPADELAGLAGAAHLNMRIVSDAAAALETTIQNADEKDIMAITGSHYLGPAIAEYFEISFDIL